MATAAVPKADCRSTTTDFGILDIWEKHYGGHQICRLPFQHCSFRGTRGTRLKLQQYVGTMRPPSSLDGTTNLIILSRRMVSPRARAGGSIATLLVLLLLALPAFCTDVSQPPEKEAPNKARQVLPSSSGVPRHYDVVQYHGGKEISAITASTRLPVHSAAGRPEDDVGRGRQRYDRRGKVMGVQKTPAEAAALSPGGTLRGSGRPPMGSTARRSTGDDSDGKLSVEGATSAVSSKNRQVSQQSRLC